ncbi:ethanolamine ammonia-lyase small subunit [Marinobacter santoriniensis NKSG1]|uniref:Ethanolamine ammonia-lyase small subunit n=1 Tax=Marinobacter santoriniensis NKSG1 TaxID=1288826 RepID=M7CSS1_9GAMM|nr:ethanolamine ammonia-lyase subunit EutC [Marinobacter santoriniensis]EMP56199.1 ethanolamine ammonia-lyase small subunit [Marinobacter santoriniensis NKSG1]
MAEGKKTPTPAVTANPWRRLRAYTDARIGLGRAGVSLPTSELLAFQLAHAQARDAVHLALDMTTLCEQLERISGRAPLRLHSRAVDRVTYLQRPDLGRCLDEDSRSRLHMPEASAASPVDLAVVVADGLSSFAVQNNTGPFLEAFLSQLDASGETWSLAPITVVEQARVAVGDEIGDLLNARAVLVLVGERPGLSSPDSLGLYLTWAPAPGRTDAERNCISNIRPAGLDVREASRRALYLLQEARRLKISGVSLKDRSETPVLECVTGPGNFLTG